MDVRGSLLASLVFGNFLCTSLTYGGEQLSRQNQFDHDKNHIYHLNDVVLARTVLRKTIHRGGDSTVLLKTFCANCAFTLPDGANFCVQCEKRMFIIHLQVHTVHI